LSCLVERAWGKSTDDAKFWNPKVNAPHCLNAPAREELSAHCADEDQTGAGGKVEDGNCRGAQSGKGRERTAGIGAECNVLHDVKAEHVLASNPVRSSQTLDRSGHGWEDHQ
jgi:hypothetical protein